MSNLDFHIAEAKRLGMSYGQYKAMLFEKNGCKPVQKKAPEPENIRHCVICGRELLPGTRRTTKTCSGPCGWELNRRRNAERYRATRKIPDTITKTCVKCGKQFTTTKRNQVYCTPECQALRYRVKVDGIKERRYGWSECQQCGRTYQKKASNQKWCSETCKRQARRR